MQNKRLIHESSIFFVENIMMDDLDDCITSFVAAEHGSANVLQECFLKKRKGGGSVPGKARNIDRGIHLGSRKLFNDYFSATPV